MNETFFFANASNRIRYVTFSTFFSLYRFPSQDKQTMGTVESIVGIVNYIEILQIEKKNNLGDIPRVLLQIEFVLFSIRMQKR